MVVGTVKKGMVENINKASERAIVTEPKRSARILRKVLSI